jgi:hypothetical protein
MTWRHERVYDGFHEGTTLPRIRDYLLNDEGVRVEPIGAKHGIWVFKYTGGDLQFDFDAYAKTPTEIDLNSIPPFWPLGPECGVGPCGNGIRIAALDETTKASIAKNIVDALLASQMLPNARPPHVEKVVFNETARKALVLWS